MNPTGPEVRFEYQVLQWEPGRVVRLHRPPGRLATLAWSLAGGSLAVAILAYVAARLLAPDLVRTIRLPAVIGVVMALVVPVIGLALFLAALSGPRTIVLDWTGGYLAEKGRGARIDHPFSSLRGMELRRHEHLGEVSPASYSCDVLAHVAVGYAVRKVEILSTELFDEPDTPYALTEPLASQLTQSLGLALTTTA